MLLACETAEEGAQNNNGKTFIFCCAITQHTKQFNYPVFYCFTQAILNTHLVMSQIESWFIMFHCNLQHNQGCYRLNS